MNRSAEKTETAVRQSADGGFLRSLLELCQAGQEADALRSTDMADFKVGASNSLSLGDTAAGRYCGSWTTLPI